LFETLNAVKSIDVVNHIAYVASTYAVYALDISDPQAPVKLWEHSGPAEGLAVQGLPPYALVADGELGLTLYAIADGIVRPANGAVDKVFPETPLVATFAQDMDTSSVTFTCTPDPGGWVTSWEETSQDDVGRELTLWHEPFMEDQDYQFELTGGKTAKGQVVESFGLSFAVVSVNKVYLPVVLRVTQP
jgi:hypothetical protein